MGSLTCAVLWFVPLPGRRMTGELWDGLQIRLLTLLPEEKVSPYAYRKSQTAVEIVKPVPWDDFHHKPEAPLAQEEPVYRRIDGNEQQGEGDGEC